MALRDSRSSTSPFVTIASAACAALALLSLASAPAEARGWRHYQHYARYAARAPAAADPAFAAIVVDANAGRTLYAVNENAPRHPASLTKVMTLYLLFEQLDKGAMTLQTEIPVSEHAAAQEPSKLGLTPGDTISVDDAIKAIVTRSANDVAVAIAEAIGGDEPRFADMMTRKAHALGMSRTLYRNASGLPNDEQITTARDLTILARATEERFPRYFKYFSTHEFAYGGEIIGNHNHLLGRVDGVDGIKTGYTRASGFNLLTSVHRDGRSLVAAVLGGRTSARARRLHGRPDPRPPCASLRPRPHRADDRRGRNAARAAGQARQPRDPPRRYSGAARASAAGQIEEGDEDSAEEATTAPAVATAKPVAAPATPKSAARPPANPVSPACAPPRRARRRTSPPPRRRNSSAGSRAPIPSRRVRSRDVAPAAAPPAQAKPATTIAAETAPAPTDHGGWIIQIGISSDAAKANDLLARARARSRGQLAQARPFTEKVAKGEDVFYRARFAGLDSASAETACRSLKKSGFACFAARD